MQHISPTQSKASLKHRILRPLNFLSIIVTGVAITIGLSFLLILIIAKPYEEPQDIRQQAKEPQDCLSMIDLPRGECEALVTFYESTNGAGWTVNAGEIAWFSTPKACEWLGIACTGNPNLERPEPVEKNVVGINLPNRRLSGQLPPIWTAFTQLSQIDLSNNSLTGIITNSQLLSVKTLVSVNLSNNKLEGYLPDVFTGDHTLVSLDISRNTGMMNSIMPFNPLPSSLAKVKTLKQLIINNTLLGDAIPTAFKELKLTVLLTANSNLCLPKGLEGWYKEIAKTDQLRLCTSITPTPTPRSCNTTCRETSECATGLICYTDATRTGHCRLESNPTNLQCQPVITATNTPTPTTRVTTTPTPTGTSGTGGTTTVGCNQACQSNVNCNNNLRCYDLGGSKRCRLATNPANESCQEIADQGLNFACNEYCSDSSECTGELTCWYNRCREATNVTSVSCTPASSELQELMQNNCGQSCAGNRDCVLNMRCYNGSCRLATNPTSQSCSPAATVKRTPTPTTAQTKGGMGSSSVNPTPTSTDATESADTIEPTQIPALPTLAPPAPPSKPGWLDQIKNWFSQFKLPTIDGSGLFNLLQSKGLLIGLVIAGIVFLLLGFATGKKRTGPKTSRLSAPPTVRSSEAPQTGMIDRIKQKGITPLK